MSIRRAGPGDRPWEYFLLLAIAKDSPHLVGLVASEYSRDLDWTAEVAEEYGRKLEGQIHYLVESFGLQWQIGDTFWDLAVRNCKASAAAAICSASSCPSEGLPAPENSVKVALVQCASEMGAVAKNLKRLERHIRKAAEEGAKIIVLPETSVTGYLSQDLQTNWGLQDRPQSYPNSMDPAVHAEERDGDSVRHMALLARELCVYITVPYLERNGVHFFNSKHWLAQRVCHKHLHWLTTRRIAHGRFQRSPGHPLEKALRTPHTTLHTVELDSRFVLTFTASWRNMLRASSGCSCIPLLGLARQMSGSPESSQIA